MRDVQDFAQTSNLKGIPNGCPCTEDMCPQPLTVAERAKWEGERNGGRRTQRRQRAEGGEYGGAGRRRRALNKRTSQPTLQAILQQVPRKSEAQTQQSKFNECNRPADSLASTQNDQNAAAACSTPERKPKPLYLRVRRAYDAAAGGKGAPGSVCRRSGKRAKTARS